MIKAVLFDLDDTLYEEKKFIVSGFRKTAEYLSRKYKINSDRVFKILRDDFDGGLRRKNFDVLLKKLSIKEPVENLIKIYREHLPLISLYPDAKVILKNLRSCGLKLGLITDGYPATQRNKISALGIRDFFEVITINDIEKGLSKKNEDSFKRTLSLLRVKTENTIYVGDNPLKDFFAAKKLGVITVRIKRKKGEYKNLRVSPPYEANYTIFSLLELEEIIKILGQGN
ncbi:HAD-IA family hydrolase [Candidatus Aerophobetes bacterium]|nr:HAD-IA family hydrolase [Candidatus Aerophobetes bacterium]